MRNGLATYKGLHPFEYMSGSDYRSEIKEGKVKKGGVGKKPTRKRPTPPKGRGNHTK